MLRASLLSRLPCKNRLALTEYHEGRIYGDFETASPGNANETPKARYERMVKQLNFSVTDDRLSQVPDLRRYVIMYVYGRFIIREVLS